MGRIITIASQKGGVGKTTLALNLGWCLGRLGGRVLLVDGDPQGSLGIASNLVRRTTLGIVDLLRGTSSPSEVLVPTRDGRMGVVGIGTREAVDAPFLERAAEDGSLAVALAGLGEGFDYVIVDAPSGIGTLPLSLLGASGSVLLVVQPRSLSLRTLPTFFRAVRWTQENVSSALRLEGVVFSLVDPTSSAQSRAVDELRASMPPDVAFRTAIPDDARLEEASEKSIPAGMLAGGREAARPYLDLALELKEREIARSQGGGEDEEHQGLF